MDIKSITNEVIKREEDKSVESENAPGIVREVMQDEAPVSTPPPTQISPEPIRPMVEERMGMRGTDEDEELKKVLASLKTNIKIVGVGGAGSNTINRIVEEGILGADIFALNSDAQHLLSINAPHKILLGRRATRGLGAGSVPQIGRESAVEAEEEIRASLQGADMVFVTCGMGGGTGTGAIAEIARIAHEMGALTIAIVTKPFAAEGIVRMQNAEYGIDILEGLADTTIVIPNDKLLEIVPRLPLNAAFKVADELLMRAIKGITEMITRVGIVNLDFADLRNIMRGGGVAVIGLGEASDTPEKAQEAVNEAINSPLVEVDVSEATGALVCVIGGSDMTVTDAEKAAEEIHNRINPHANIIWGAYVDQSLEHAIRVMLVITGVKSAHIRGPGADRVARAGDYDIDFIK
jgi:cell division protein FtsZ